MTDSISTSPPRDNSQPSSFISNIHQTLHSIYNPQELSYTPHTYQILIALHDTFLSQQAISTLKKENVQEYINALVNSHIFETHLFPLINSSSLPSSIIHVLYIFMERLIFCVRTFGSDSSKQHVKELFVNSPGIWSNIIKQTASCINFEMVKDEPWNSETRCRVSIYEMVAKTLQPMLLSIDVLNRVLEIENPHIAYSTSKIENLHNALIQRLEKENMLDFIILASQKLSQILNSKRPTQEREKLLKPSLYILRACSLIFKGENADEMIWACEYGEKYDQQLLAQFHNVQRNTDRILQESIPSRHTRFGGKLLRKVNNPDSDSDDDKASVPKMIVDSLQLHRDNVDVFKTKSKSYAFRKSRIQKRLPCEIESTGYKIKSILKSFAEKLLNYKFRDVMQFIMDKFIADRDLPVASKDTIIPLQSKEDFLRVSKFLLATNRGNSEAKARNENSDNPTFILNTDSIVDYIDLEFLDSFFLFLRMNSDPQSRKNVDKHVLFELYSLLEEAAGYIKEISLSLLYMIKHGSNSQDVYSRKVISSLIYDRENIRSLMKLVRHYNYSKNSILYLCDLVETIENLFQCLNQFQNGELTVKKYRTHISTTSNDDKDEEDNYRDKLFDFQSQLLPQFARKHVLDKYAYLLKKHKTVRSSTILAVISMFKLIDTFEIDIEAESSVLYNMNFMSIFFNIVQDKTFLENNSMEDLRNPDRLEKYNSFIQFIYKIVEKMFTHFRNENIYHFSRLVFGEQRSLPSDEMALPSGYSQDDYQDTGHIANTETSDEEVEYQFSQEQEFVPSQDDQIELKEIFSKKKPKQSKKTKKSQDVSTKASKPSSSNNKSAKRLRKKSSTIQQLELLSQEYSGTLDEENEIVFDPEGEEIPKKIETESENDEEHEAVMNALRSRRQSTKLDDTEEEITFDDSTSDEDENQKIENSLNLQNESEYKMDIDSNNTQDEIQKSFISHISDKQNQKLKNLEASSQMKAVAESIDLAQLGDSINYSDDSMIIVDEESSDEDMEDLSQNNVSSTLGDQMNYKPISRFKGKKSTSNTHVSHPVVSSFAASQQPASIQAEGKELDLSQLKKNDKHK